MMQHQPILMRPFVANLWRQSVRSSYICRLHAMPVKMNRNLLKWWQPQKVLEHPWVPLFEAQRVVK